MPTDYKVGDKVQLKSGGPVMTVATVRAIDPVRATMNKKAGRTSNPTITCQWFSGRKLEHGNFPPEALKRVKGEEGKEQSNDTQKRRRVDAPGT